MKSPSTVLVAYSYSPDVVHHLVPHNQVLVYYLECILAPTALGLCQDNSRVAAIAASAQYGEVIEGQIDPANCSSRGRSIQLAA